MPSMPDAVVLCGGAGLRLRSVTGDAPKSMASVADRPFLELLFKQLGRYGVKRVVLAVGYQADVIERHFGVRAFDMDVTYSRETAPLGTAGALRNALDFIGSDICLVTNGDSYTDIDLRQLIEKHRQSKADVTMVVVPVDGRNDSGLVQIDDSGTLISFAEKQAHTGQRYANAGIYIIAKKLIADIPAAVQVSIEREVFPRWLSEGKRVQTFVASTGCVDIGTPERYQNAQHALADVESVGIENS